MILNGVLLLTLAGTAAMLLKTLPFFMKLKCFGLSREFSFRDGA